MITINFSGNFKEIINDLEKMKKNMDNIQLTREMLEILDLSRARCPVKTGFLRSSAFIEHAKNSWTIGYTASYAIYVHELHRTKSKFLETPFLQGKSKIYQSIIKQLSK